MKSTTLTGPRVGEMTFPITQTSIDAMVIGAQVPAAATFTNCTVNGSLVASNLAATSLAGGANGSLPYQTAADTTAFLAAGTQGYVLTMGATVPTWSAAGGSSYNPAAVAITGGTVNGAVLGGVTPAAASVTTLVATSTITPNATAGIVGSDGTTAAQAGSIGEIITATGTGVSISSSIINQVVSIELTPGDWDVNGNLTFIVDSGTTPTAVASAVSASNSAFPAAPLTNGFNTAFTASVNISCPCPYQPIKVTAPTTYYLIAYSVFSGGTMEATGSITARRAR